MRQIALILGNYDYEGAAQFAKLAFSTSRYANLELEKRPATFIDQEIRYEGEWVKGEYGVRMGRGV